MKIATWNVNSIRTRQKIIIDWLQQHQIDVLCLQETKVRDEDFPRSPFAELGYNLYISGQKSYNGVAIFSKTPLTDVKFGFTPIVGNKAADFDLQKRVISGRIDNIRLVNLYVPNGAAIGSGKYQYKLDWFKILREYLVVLKTESSEMWVCGDFNIAPENKDIYTSEGRETHIMSSPAEREALGTILELGLRDAFRKFTTEPGHYSWWDYRGAGFARNRGWRIDHHYLTSELYTRAINCWIDIEPRKLDKPSDHAPVVVEV
ncbi:exodeoxyribonuclease III [Myxosarcina sp. GI1(2024)]